MKRISIGFYDEVCEQLKEIMKEEGLPTLAQCIRELVDLALRIKNSAKNSNAKNDETNLLNAVSELKNLFKNNMSWSLETRLLTRFLVENHVSGNGEKRIDILEKYQKSAVDYVQGLYGER